MQLIWDGLREAMQLVLSGDPLIIAAALRSLWITTTAVALAAVVGLPLGVGLARSRWPGTRLAVLLFRAGMALPTVFVGVVCYAMFSRRGPLGPLEVLYTPWAIVVGEFVLALPIIVGLSHGAVKSLDPRVGETAWTLGAGLMKRFATFLSEARVGVTLAVLTAFARCVTELGIAMIVGGNIKGRTRTLATATALETSKGEFARGMAMGLFLVLIALGVAALMGWVSREREK